MTSNLGPRIVKAFAQEHADKSVRIIRGGSTRDTAMSPFEGETPVLRVSGEAVLARAREAARRRGTRRRQDALT